jgi:hypothetical protein
MKTIKFFSPSPEIAQKIQEYFPNITELNGSILIFSKFDLSAFVLAIDLEGLTEFNYLFIDKNKNKIRFYALRKIIKI